MATTEKNLNDPFETIYCPHYARVGREVGYGAAQIYLYEPLPDPDTPLGTYQYAEGQKPVMLVLCPVCQATVIGYFAGALVRDAMKREMAAISKTIIDAVNEAGRF